MTLLTRHVGGWRAFFESLAPAPHLKRMERHARGDYAEPEDDEQEQKPSE